MTNYLSINLYMSADLRPFGKLVGSIVDALILLPSEFRPVKFSADLIGSRRKRYFRITPTNLGRLRKELLAGTIRDLHMNDNEGTEAVDPRFAYETSLYDFDFWLDIAQSRTNVTQKLYFLVNLECATSRQVFSDILDLSKRAFCGFSACWGDIYCCSSHMVCFEHAMGIPRVKYRRDASDDFKTMIIDNAPFLTTLCDTLARDAYFGVFLNHAHIRLLGGIERLREKVPFEVIEELPNGGAFLMASSNPFDFDKPEIRERIECLREVLRPIAMFQFEDSSVAREYAKQLRSSLSGNGLV